MAKRTLHQLLCMTTLLAVTANSYAVLPGFYIGGQVGYARTQIENLSVNNVPDDVNNLSGSTKPISMSLNSVLQIPSPIPGNPPSNLQVLATPTAFHPLSPVIFPFKSSRSNGTFIGRFYLGYVFWPWIGGEVGFGGLGNTNSSYKSSSTGQEVANIYAINGLPASTTLTGIYHNVSRTDQVSNQFADLFVKLMLPVYWFDAYVKLGGAYVRSQTDTSIRIDSLTNGAIGAFPPFPAGIPNGTYSSTTPLHAKIKSTSSRFVPAFAIGASYYYAQNIGVDLSYTQYRGSNTNHLSYIALGVSYHFVEKYCGQFLC